MNRAGRGIDAGARAVADEWPRLGDVNVGTNRSRMKMNVFIIEFYLFVRLFVSVSAAPLPARSGSSGLVALGVPQENRYAVAARDHRSKPIAAQYLRQTR